MKLRMLLIGVVLNLCAVNVKAQVPATWLGTWKLNVAKSKYIPGPPPKSQIDKNEAVEGALKYASDRVSADGKPSHHEYTAKLDGKDYPYIGLPIVDTISMTKINDNAMEWALKKGGKALMSGQTVYSPDGKLRTWTWTGTNPQGQKLEITAVFEKQ
jgi:hypothetical protein